jgi:arabinan endo-1,5-alpha-L-arabinosidase
LDYNSIEGGQTASQPTLIMFLNTLFAAVLSAAALVAAYPDPRSCTGDCIAIDPAVIRRDSDGTYFRFNTFNDIGIYKATTLDGPWSYEGGAITAGSIIAIGTSPNNLWVR